MSTNLPDDLADMLAFTPEAFASLGAHVCPEWVTEALSAGACGENYAKMRERKLPVLQALLSAADRFDTLAAPAQHRLRRLIVRHRVHQHAVGDAAS